MGSGCQSTSDRIPIGDGLDSEVVAQQTPTGDGDLLSQWLLATIEYIEALNEQGQFTKAKLFLESQREQVERTLHLTTSRFELDSLKALSEFLDNPIHGIELANELRPGGYTQSGVKAWLLGYMHWTLQDCEQAVSEMSKFLPVGTVDGQAWSRKIWNVLDSWCMYRYQDGLSDQTNNAAEWWELAHLLGTSISPIQQYERFEQWKVNHPQHLASRFPPVQFDTTHDGPDHVALLLPQSGSLSSAARAIRNGFLTAHLSNIHANRNVRVELFDTEENDISHLVDQVIADGVDVIVGPLDKDRVRHLVRGDTLSVPIIALNRVPETSVANSSSLQLGLVVEDDVAAISRRLQDMRARRVLLLIGREYWCARASVEFKETLRSGVQIADETFLSDPSEITEAVAQILLVAQSNSRHEVLQDLIGEVEFNARRRHDIDAVVAFVDYTEFGSLAAAMQYHFAGDIPILVAEPTFRHREQQVEYESGTFFTSIPATLYPTSMTHDVFDSFTDADELFPLYAFGIDAYRVAMNIPNLIRGESVFGLTGVLSIQESGVIARKPVWGMVAQHSLAPAPVIPFPIRSQLPSLLTNQP